MRKKKKDYFIVDDDDLILDDEEYDPDADDMVQTNLTEDKKKKKRKLVKKNEGSTKRRKTDENDEGDKFESVIMNSIRTQARSRDANSSETLSAEYSINLLRKMVEANEADHKCIDKGLIPVNKLNLLPELKEKASQVYIQLALIEDGLLINFCDWLKPYKEKLPSLQIRTTLFDLMLSLPCDINDGNDSGNAQFYNQDSTYEGITVQKLKESGIGQIVSFYSKHPKEIPSNKGKCRKLVEKWSRVINKNNDDDEENKRDFGNDVRLKTIVEFTSKAKEPNEPGFINRATVPRVIGYDFLKKPLPKSVDKIRGGKLISATRERMDKKLYGLKRRARTLKNNKFNR